MKKMQLTMMVEKGDDGWICGQLLEYPAVISQGKTMTELRENIKDALSLYLDFQKEKVNMNFSSKTIKTKTLVFER